MTEFDLMSFVLGFCLAVLITSLAEALGRGGTKS